MTASKVDIFELGTQFNKTYLENPLKIAGSEVESNTPEIFDVGTSKKTYLKAIFYLPFLYVMQIHFLRHFFFYLKCNIHFNTN